MDNRVEREKVRMLLRRYAKIFDTTKLSVIDTTIKHAIDLEEGSRPTIAAYYRQNLKTNEFIDEAVKQLLQEDGTERSYLAWSSPIVLVKKKDGSSRFRINFCKLNHVTTKDNYGPPRQDKIFDQCSGCTYFIKFNFNSGYHQVPIAEKDPQKQHFEPQKDCFN
ncbi:unnamed protein product [Didymodactylos carnosus]|uniref:Reverse transcriptase n=1 Tax=Didymodactylos carnosus TaxID=1234261 RepID=A0A8S2EXG2_9BILA|nr:unnamed protein product [Didymodactylos carnosus]CAF4134875.1 unnamed protein product [Didymodactylos carnosus]